MLALIVTLRGIHGTVYDCNNPFFGSLSRIFPRFASAGIHFLFWLAYYEWIWYRWFLLTSTSVQCGYNLFILDEICLSLMFILSTFSVTWPLQLKIMIQTWAKPRKNICSLLKFSRPGRGGSGMPFLDRFFQFWYAYNKKNINSNLNINNIE